MFAGLRQGRSEQSRFRRLRGSWRPLMKAGHSRYVACCAGARAVHGSIHHQAARLAPPRGGCARIDPASGGGVAPGDEQVGQSEQHGDALRVLRQPPVAHLRIAEAVLGGRACEMSILVLRTEDDQDVGHDPLRRRFSDTWPSASGRPADRVAPMRVNSPLLGVRCLDRSRSSHAVTAAIPVAPRRSPTRQCLLLRPEDLHAQWMTPCAVAGMAGATITAGTG